MPPPQDHGLADLRLMNLLGEGGFGKVFRGTWRGQNVGVKVGVNGKGGGRGYCILAQHFCDGCLR